MSQPEYGSPEGQPQPQQSPEYGQAPDYAQPDYGRPDYGQPTYGQTPPPTPGYGQQGFDSPYGQQPYGQPTFGQMSPYGQGPYYNAVPQEHPQANTVLILGILGFFVPVVQFVAWYLGGNAKKEIEAGAPYQWGGSLMIGYWLGKVMSILAIAGVALMVLMMILAVISAMAF